MAQRNSVYDPDADEKPVHHQLPPGSSGAPGPGRQDEGLDREGLRDAEKGFYNPNGDTTGGTEAKSETPGSLKNSEQSAQDDSLYNPEGDQKSDGRSLRGTAKNTLLFGGRSGGSFLPDVIKNNKLLVGGALGGSAAIIIFIILLLVFLGNYKLVQLGEHIASYQFARVTRNYSEHVSEITVEDTALSTADRSTLQKAYDQFGAVKDNTWGSMWEKIDNYRPDKIVENMQSNGTLDFQYADRSASNLWKKKLTAVVVDGKEIPVNNPGLFDKYIHPLQTRSDRLAFSDEFNGALSDAMHGRSSIIRGAVAKAIRDEYGINLQWWKQLSKYNGADEKKAAALTEAESEETINESIKTAPSEVSQVSSAEADAQNAVNKCASDAKCTAEEVRNRGQLPKSVLDIMNQAASSDIFQKAIGFVNPTYTVGLPVCLIYDGSLQNGGSGQSQTINNTNAQAQRTFYAVETAGDQEKAGKTTGEAVSGMDWKLGDITKSVPEKRASGIPVDTSSDINPQSSVTGQLGNTTSIFSFLPSPASGLADSVAGSACPLVTNLWVGGVVGVGNLIAGFFSGETSTAAEDGLATAIGAYLRDFASQAFTKKEAAKLGVLVGGTEGLTILAKMLVAQKAAVANSGFATGPSFDNVADAGGNLNANETGRAFYGRPLTNAEVADASLRDKTYTSATLARESSFQRYLAISNPDSLATKVGTSISTHANTSFFSSLVSDGAKLFNPIGSLGHLFGSFSPRMALAAGSTNNQDYGIVQWGWSNDEENLIKNDTSYLPLENQKVLEDSGESDAIAQKYGVCFDLKTPISDLLTGSDPKIVRADNGDVVRDKGLCSPDNLTYTNSEFGPQMVFRWRLEKNYEKTMDQLTSAQEITTSDTSNPSATTASGLTNPFPGGWIPNRLDMGYDGNFKGKIVAPFDATVTYASSSWSNWGGYIEIKADQKPAGLPTSTLYFAEGVAPLVHAGQHITAGTPIASEASSPYGNSYGHGASGAIEWGVAQDGSVGSPTNTYVYGQCGSAAAKQAVLDFEQWAIQSLGVAPHDKSLADNNPGCP